MLDIEGHALLTDFGLSKEGVESSDSGATSFCGYSNFKLNFLYYIFFNY